jgi:homoserine kinase
MFSPRIQHATAMAPASVGNVAVGFDLLGHALQGAGDTVTVRRCQRLGVHVVGIHGLVNNLPRDAKKNTASAAVLAMWNRLGLGDEVGGAAFAPNGADTARGIELEIEKGIPLASGMGGSAASAVAAVAALNGLLAEPLPNLELYPFALAGEMVASGGELDSEGRLQKGAAHGDNVAASLLGGLTLCHPDPERLPLRLAVPDSLQCVLVHPDLEIRTADSRAILPKEVPLETAVAQSANLAWLLAGCQSGRIDWIRGALADILVEPHRQAFIPGFEQVQQLAIDRGALGCSISGAGPSVFAWFDQARNRNSGPDSGSSAHPTAPLQDVADAMVDIFAQHKLTATSLVSPVDCPGVQLLSS